MITAIASVVGNAIVTAKRAGKTEGIIQTTIGAISQRVDKVERNQAVQWGKIDEHTADIGYLKGRVNGKAHGHTTGL